MNKYKISFGLIIAMMAIIVGCEREIDAPPGHEIPAGSILDIDSLISLNSVEPEVNFTEELSVYGVATTDESTGTFYHEFYLQDENTGSAIHINLINPGGITQGDRVRVRLMGTTLMRVHDLLTLDHVDIDSNVYIQENNIAVEPQLIELSSSTSYYEAFESRLVTIENIQVIADESCSTFAIGSPNNTSMNRTVEDCNGNTIILRNSGYSNFADQVMPTGNGTFTGILGRYNDDWQLYVRTPSELDLNGTRCNGDDPFDCESLYLNEGFADDNIAPWTSIQVIGADEWATSTQGSSSNVPYASISNYNGSGNDASESWLVSESIDLSASTTPKLSFITAVGYSGPDLEVYVSTDYIGGAVDISEWTMLSATMANNSSFFTWTDSGEIDLSSYISDNVHIAFRYQGGDSNGATWEVDNIVISD